MSNGTFGLQQPGGSTDRVVYPPIVDRLAAISDDLDQKIAHMTTFRDRLTGEGQPSAGKNPSPPNSRALPILVSVIEQKLKHLEQLHGELASMF